MPDPAPRLRHRGLRRALAQSGVLVALVAVFTVSSATAGTGALLMTAGNDRALSAAVAQLDGTEKSNGADLTSLLVTADMDADHPLTADVAMPVVQHALADAASPYDAQVSLWATTPMLYLEGKDVRTGYLLDADTLPDNASLQQGSWPPTIGGGGRIPVAIPTATAQALGLQLGSQLSLAEHRRDGRGAGRTYELVVVGIFVPADTPAWRRDRLLGRGYQSDYLLLPTYGPFVVGTGSLDGLAAPVERVAAVLDPDLEANAVDLPQLVQHTAGAGESVKDALGPAAQSVWGTSRLGTELARMRAELAVTDALVLAVFVLVLTLAAATAALVARVLVARRAGERALMRERGASRPQLVRGAAVEALALGALATAVAAPIAVAGYRLTAPPPPVTSASALSPALVLGLLAGALLPAAVMVLTALPERVRRRRWAEPGELARSGADLLLAGLAAVAYVQLRTHVVTPGQVDPLLVAAPAVSVLAVAALVTRLLPLLTRLADLAARRGRGLVLPLAGWHLARGGGIRGVFLLVLAVSVGTFGVTFLGSWENSHRDQAAAEVGADLVVTDTQSPGATISGLTGGTVSPVADNAVVLGSRPSGVKMLAVKAPGAITGRPPTGTTWPQVMSELSPREAGSPLVVPGGPLKVTVTGGLTQAPRDGLPMPDIMVTPTLVLADEWGATTTRTGSEVPLDHSPHMIGIPLPGEPGLPAGTWRVVAIDLHLVERPGVDLFSWGVESSSFTATVTIDGATSPSGAWGGAGDTGAAAVRHQEARVAGDTVQASFSCSVLGLSWHDAHLTLLSFPASAQVPVALTDDLARELGLKVGDRIGVAWDTAPLEAVVVRTVPYVPSHPREPAVLAELTSLQRAMLSVGRLDPLTDRWWVGSPMPGAAEAVRAAGAGTVVDQADTVATYRDGPLRTPLRFAWWLAILAAVGFAVTGSAAHAAAQARRQGTTLARVRAIGASRREALVVHAVQHAAVTVLSVVVGTASGVLLAALLVPVLVVSPTGARAVPAPLIIWPAGSLSLVVATILVGGLVVGVPAAVSVVGRSTVAALRAGEAP